MVQSSIDTGNAIKLIVGMSRAGTTAMVRCLNSHPDVCAFGETSFWSRNWVKPNKNGFYDLEHLNKVAAFLRKNSITLAEAENGLHGEIEYLGRMCAESVSLLSPPVSPETVFNVIGTVIAKEAGKKQWIEKTPNHIQHIGRILKYCDDVRLLVMIREPMDFMLSYKHQGDRKKKEVRIKFKKLYNPIVVSIVVRGYLTSTKTLLDNIPDKVIVTSISDIYRNSEKVFTRIQDNYQLSFSAIADKFIKVNSSFPDKRAYQLDNEDKLWLYLIAGRSADKLGLKVEKVPVNLYLLIRSSVTIIPWIFANYDLIRRSDSQGLTGMIKRWLR